MQSFNTGNYFTEFFNPLCSSIRDSINFAHEIVSSDSFIYNKKQIIVTYILYYTLLERQS